MLQIDKVQQIEGVTVYGDNEQFNVFYPLPQQPRYRLNADGKPSFGFYKYRFPVDHPTAGRAAAFSIFDVEFVARRDQGGQSQGDARSAGQQEANRRGISRSRR